MSKIVGVVGLSMLLATASPAFAQADTALARQVHAEVGRQLASLDQASFAAKRPDVEYASAVKAWADTSGVRKLEVTDRDDSGDVVTEYDYAGGALVFVYQAIQGFDDAGRQVTRGEERQYFRDDRMFKWLSGKEAAANAASDPAFAEEGRTRLAASVFYVKAAREAYARKAAATAKPAPAAPPTGRFVRQGKEDGIVAHLTIRSSTATEVVFDLTAVLTSQGQANGEIAGGRARLAGDDATYRAGSDCTITMKFSAARDAADLKQTGPCEEEAGFGAFVDVTGRYKRE